MVNVGHELLRSHFAAQLPFIIWPYNNIFDFESKRNLEKKLNQKYLVPLY
jgi:hypothetical protein